MVETLGIYLVAKWKYIIAIRWPGTLKGQKKRVEKDADLLFSLWFLSDVIDCFIVYKIIWMVSV